MDCRARGEGVVAAELARHLEAGNFQLALPLARRALAHRSTCSSDRERAASVSWRTRPDWVSALVAALCFVLISGRT
ncbi:MAG TPA: hypothetical protein VLV17_00420 [Anaeromyxobacteraceae bacterium]|nr:hypothetical protein [Anaeromyxobacteraceae bacterium]